MDDATDSPQQQGPTLIERARAAQAKVTRSLAGRMPLTPEQELRELADVTASLAEPRVWDRYGERGPVALLEQHVAALLDKPAAAFFPSGTMAQQAMLRAWTDEQGSARVALPELSHLLQHEADGPRLLHGFEFEPLTLGARVPGVDDLAAVPSRLGAVLLELPLRDAGFLLPTWDELTAFSRACRDRGVPLHLDGARLWESSPHLGHAPAEIAGLSDSVYVSFYKGLGGLAGAAVAGPETQVAQARLWRKRMGGTLFTLMPYAASALRGLETELPRMAEYHHRAKELAEGLVARGIRVSPKVPHTNAFRIFVEADPDDLTTRMVEVMEQDGVALTPPWRAGEVPGWAWTEFTVGSATMEWAVEHAVAELARVFLD
jgi:threonine aldolase